MISIRFFLASLYLLLTLAGSAAMAHDSCEGDLISELQLSGLNGPLAIPFFSSRELFFNDKKVQLQGKPFFASNEFDWHQTPWDTAATDVVVGFGTNSAWDIANRKNPSLLVIGDWMAGPLIAQQYIHRPLLRVARTPIEYLFFLLSLEAPEARLKDSLAQFEDYVDTEVQKISPTEVLSNQIRLLARFRAAGLSPEEITAIGEYYRALIVGSRPGQFGVLRGRYAEYNGNLIQYFLTRYLPKHQEHFGGARDLINNPDYSFLSSQNAFDRFKKLYGTSLYAHTDYMNESFYRQLKEHGDAKGYRRYTFSISNIMDANGDSREQAMAELAKFRAMIERVFPHEKYDVVIFLTTNYMFPHGFLRLKHDTVVQPYQWVRKAS